MQLLYAPSNHELEVLYEATDYYLKFEIKNPRLYFALFTSFYSMEDTYINNEKEFEELTEMIKKKQTPKELKKGITLIDNKKISTSKRNDC